MQTTHRQKRSPRQAIIRALTLLLSLGLLFSALWAAVSAAGEDLSNADPSSPPTGSNVADV
ncbi:MAG: hypothetical protein ACP5JG_17905, partial [Anaerolineae bacterium]